MAVGAGPVSALGLAIPFSISPFDSVASFWLYSKLECVLDKWFCFSGSMGSVSRVVSEPLVASSFCGVVIVKSDVAQNEW